MSFTPFPSTGSLGVVAPCRGVLNAGCARCPPRPLPGTVARGGAPLLGPGSIIKNQTDRLCLPAKKVRVPPWVPGCFNRDRDANRGDAMRRWA